MSIFEYIILGLGFLFTILWCLKIREKAKNEQATEKAIELQGLLMTCSLILIFILHISPFHLLWMLPASFILGLLSIATPLKFLWFLSSIYFKFWYIGITNEGRRYYNAKEYEKAIEYFKKEIIKKPTSAETYFNLGLAYGKIGQHENEVKAYQQSIKLKPNHPEISFNLAVALNDNNEKEKAIEALKHTIATKPNYLKAHYLISKIYFEMGDLEKAKQEYEIVKTENLQMAKDLEKFLGFV